MAMNPEQCLNTIVPTGGVNQSLRAREVLFDAGDETIGVYLVVSGRIRLVRFVDDGDRESVLFIARPGDAFAEASPFSPVYHCAAVAETDAVVRRYPKAALLAAFAASVEPAMAYAAMVARQLMATRVSMERRSMRSAVDRIRHYLLVEGGEERSVEITGSLRDFGAELGLTEEALYRTLAKMVKDGTIRRTATGLTLLDRAGSTGTRDDPTARPATAGRAQIYKEKS